MKKMEGIIGVPSMEQNFINAVIGGEKDNEVDYMTDIMLLVDESASISYYEWEDEMIEGIANIKKCLMERKNANSIRICVLGFGNTVPKKAEFVPVDKMNTDYNPCQSQTKLYETICTASNLMLQHIKAMEEKNVRGSIIVATDGEDIGSEHLYKEAKKAIRTLREENVDFQYICIGNKAVKCAKILKLTDKEILKVEGTNAPHKISEQFVNASARALKAAPMAL